MVYNERYVNAIPQSSNIVIEKKFMQIIRFICGASEAAPVQRLCTITSRLQRIPGVGVVRPWGQGYSIQEQCSPLLEAFI